MNIKDFFRIFLLSFYSSTLYINVACKWRNWGLKFLLQLSIFISITSTFILLLILYSINFKDLGLDIEKKFPQLNIENNIASFKDELKSPVKIKNNNQDVIIVDLDINDSINYNNAIMVFTKDKLEINLFKNKIYSLNYEELSKITKVKIIDGDLIIELAEIGKRYSIMFLWLVGIPLGSLIYFGLSLLKSGFYAMLASVIFKFSNNSLSFKQLFRLANIVQAPAAIFSVLSPFLLVIFGPNSLIQNILSSLYIVYFLYAISVNNKYLNTK